MHRTFAHRLAALAALGLLAAGVVGCSTDPDGSAGGSPSGPPSSPSSSPVSPAAGGSSSTEPAVAEVPPCGIDQLLVRTRPVDASLGTYQLRFRNTSASSCTVRGYPRVVAHTEAGTTLGDPAAEDRSFPVHRYTLSPGGPAEVATLTVTQARPGCDLVQSAALRVGLPGAARTVRSASGIGVCYPEPPTMAVTVIGTTS